MSPSPTPGRPRTGEGTDPLGPILVFVPALLLAYVSSLGLLVGIALAAAGAIGFALVARISWARIHALPAVPAVAVLGTLAVAAPPLPVTELIAGAGGVAVLLALGRSTVPRTHRGYVTSGVGIPLLAVLVALATAFLFPASHQLVGVAALFAVGAAAAMAMLLAEADEVDGEGSPAS